MKVTREEPPPRKFLPVTIVLETPEEARLFRHVLSCFENPSNCVLNPLSQDFATKLILEMRDLGMNL